MDIGKLSQRIRLQQRAVGQDQLGGEISEPGAWLDVATVWAAVEDMSGRQYFAAQAAQNPVQTKITIRRRNGVVPAMRILHGGNVYDIEAVLEQGRTALLLMCSRGVNNG